MPSWGYHDPCLYISCGANAMGVLIVSHPGGCSGAPLLGCLAHIFHPGRQNSLEEKRDLHFCHQRSCNDTVRVCACLWRDFSHCVSEGLGVSEGVIFLLNMTQSSNQNRYQLTILLANHSTHVFQAHPKALHNSFP